MLDPQARAFLDQLASSGQPQLHEMPPEAAREAATGLTAQLGGPPEEVAEVRSLAIPGPAGTIPARLYIPAAGAKPLPALVYYHGGGFVIGSLDGWDPVMRSLANAGGCAVVSVDYRLAPEHRFPAAVDDAYAAFEYVAQQAGALGIDPKRIAVGGDSAGGNLAAVVSILARDKGGPKIAFQLLVYPVTDQNFERSSYKKYGENHFLSLDMMRWFFGHYTSGETIGDWRVQPLHAESLRNLPPAHIIVAECDPLHDEGEAYGERLRAEGGTVTFVRYPGMIHGFFTFPAALDQGRQAIADAGAALRSALGAAASSAVGAGSAP